MFNTSGDVQYIGGCSVHRGMFSTSGDVQYIGGISWVHWGDIMSTLGGYHEYIGGVQYIRGISWVHRGMFSTSKGYPEYIGGISWVHWGMFSKLGGYHEYTGGCSVHWGDTMSTSGDIMSTSGDIMSTSGGYHEYTGGCSVHWGMFSTLGFSNRNWKVFTNSLPHMHHDTPLMYWTSPDVLMIFPRCTHDIPHMHHDIPHMHYDIPPMYWTSPGVLMISPQCTHCIPPMYWTPPDVLNIPRCTEHTLYRVCLTVQIIKLKINCKGLTSWCHMKELSKCWRTLGVSLKSAKPFSSYEALKMGRGILTEVGKCRFPTFRTPHYCRKWRHHWTVKLGKKLLVLISTLHL